MSYFIIRNERAKKAVAMEIKTKAEMWMCEEAMNEPVPEGEYDVRMVGDLDFFPQYGPYEHVDGILNFREKAKSLFGISRSCKGCPEEHFCCGVLCIKDAVLRREIMEMAAL